MGALPNLRFHEFFGFSLPTTLFYGEIAAYSTFLSPRQTNLRTIQKSVMTNIIFFTKRPMTKLHTVLWANQHRLPSTLIGDVS